MKRPDSTGERPRESAATSRARFRILAAVVLLGFGILIGRSIHHSELPTLSVVGLSRTNGITDRALVNFHNRSGRAVNFSYRIRAYTTNGWRDANDHDPNARLLWWVAAGGSHVFSVPPPPARESLWGVGCSYEDLYPGPVTRWTSWLGYRLFHREFTQRSRTIFVEIEDR